MGDEKLGFINDWLEKSKAARPDSEIIKAICDASTDSKLDEAKLLLALRVKAKLVDSKKKV